MQQRLRLAGAVEISRLLSQLEIPNKQHRRDELPPEFVQLELSEQDRRQQCRYKERRVGSGQKPLGSAIVECIERERPITDAPGDHGGDKKAGYDKEYVDPKVAALQGPKTGMIKHDNENREASKRLNVRSGQPIG
jgi:hypothetical protein